MGFTIVISMRTQLRISVSRWRIILRCLRRSLTLIFLGLVVNAIKGTTLGELRFSGILQLLGVSYFICATIEAIFTKAQRTFQVCCGIKLVIYPFHVIQSNISFFLVTVRTFRVPPRLFRRLGTVANNHHHIDHTFAHNASTACSRLP